MLSLLAVIVSISLTFSFVLLYMYWMTQPWFKSLTLYPFKVGGPILGERLNVVVIHLAIVLTKEEIPKCIDSVLS